MSLTLPNAMPLTDGWFGNGHYTHAALLGGWFWTLTGDELFLVYRDDGAGTFNDALPCAAVAASESSVAIELQTLEPTA